MISLSVDIPIGSYPAACLALQTDSVKKELISATIRFTKSHVTFDLKLKSAFGMYIFGEISGKNWTVEFDLNV